MRKLLFTFLMAFFLLSLSPTLGISDTSLSINVKIIDAVTNKPIENATIILFDTSTFNKYIYFTDENGECVISGNHIRLRNFYWLYAYKGDFEAKRVEYAPVVEKRIYFEKLENKSLILNLIPGALIELEGIPYIVQSSSLEERYMSIKVVEIEKTNYTFIREYSPQDIFLLGLSRKMVIAPANIPFILEVDVFYFMKERGRVAMGREVFYIDNSSQPFVMLQGDAIVGGSPDIKPISYYSLRRGLNYVDAILDMISRKIHNAQTVGFTVFDEMRLLRGISQKVRDAQLRLQSAQVDDEFKKVWLMLREALGEMEYISVILDSKYLVSKTNAVYLSAVVAVFSIVLAFFFFEDERKKIISSILFYALFLTLLYFIHPGAHVIIDENITLFASSALISFITVLTIIFVIPRVWKERSVEGEVSWRSAISIIFSMGKRQIKRKRIRGFFTIFSICILVLAFTSLTSFGTVFGIISERVNATPSSEGILVRRMINGSSLLFLPLGYGDIIAISEIMPIVNVSIRLKNLPSIDPVIRLVNPNTKSSHFIYGVIAISPTKEDIYTRLREVVTGDRYLSESGYGEILISSSVARSLGVNVGDVILVEVLNTKVREEFVISGLIDDDKYENLLDVDGSYFGPSRFEGDVVRRCNSTEIAIINLETAERIHEIISREHEEPRQFVLPAEIVFQPATTYDTEASVKKIVSIFGYDVFVSSKGAIYYYYIGSYIEFKGVAEMLIPMVMVILNVSMVMVNSAYERSKEIRVLSMLGLNPTHIGLTFVAEAVVMGMVGGSLGYLAGLGFYRIMILFGQDLMVREKLEWWWSALGFALAIVISVLSAARPAAMAVSAYTPSKVKRVKRTEEEIKKRREEIFKVYQARELSMPIKVLAVEKEFFISYFLDKLDELRTGYVERVENVEDIPEIEDARGNLIKEIKFTYYFGPPEHRRGTKNALTLIKSPSEEYYRVKLSSEPVSPGMPESVMDRTVDFVHEILMRWVRDKKRIMGIA
ncbi:MAG: FtsX-like permease family protein [Candidatus Bathyarchaeia archaeon]